VICQAQQWYRKCLEELRGLGYTAPDKAQVYPHHLLVIGWEFNLRFDRWYVQPQKKALNELRGRYSSFNRMLSPNRSFIDSLVELLRDGQQLIQTLIWRPNGGHGFYSPQEPGSIQAAP
jgi:hypothetical protein